MRTLYYNSCMYTRNTNNNSHTKTVRNYSSFGKFRPIKIYDYIL